MRGEEILAPKVSDDALLNLAAVAKRFDQAKVLVPTVGSLDRAEKQGAPLRHYSKRSEHLYSSDK